MGNSNPFDADFDALPGAGDERAAEKGAGLESGDRLGLIVGGSLSKGLQVKLDREISLESLAVGRYVVAHGEHSRFFCMLTDVALDGTSDLLSKMPPDTSDPFLAAVHAGTTTFGTVHLSPMLVLANEGGEVKPVKTIPGHFTAIFSATQNEVSEVFGEEGTRKVGNRNLHFFHIGAPLDMEGVRVTLNLERLVERSTGVFGKSGTGKSFLSRMLLAGIIREAVAVNLIFDMHNEYGWHGTLEGGGEVKALKQIFPGRVKIFTLDDESSRRRGSDPDQVVYIGLDQIEPADLEILASSMNLSEPQMGAIYALHRRYHKDWLGNLLDDEWIESCSFEDDNGKELSGIEALARQTGQMANVLQALRRRFERMRTYRFIKKHAPENAIGNLMKTLQADANVVLEFGRYGGDQDAYIMVANFITRRLHEMYRELKEASFTEKGKEPRPLVITIEEAHKFLQPGVGEKTIFGIIARELRKYNVTLMIVDQRPSGIDPEVMSQLGTRMTLLLDNPSDIQAVLSGMSGGTELREVLARLDTQQQALIMGHAVPMPVVLHTRPYDAEFFKAMGLRDGEQLAQQVSEEVTAVRGSRDFRGYD